MPSLPPNPTWKKYEDYLRRETHQLIAWGYESARLQINSALEEEVITEYIASAIQNRLEDFDSPEFVDNYSIKEENPVREQGKTGKRRRRTDILIEHHKQGLRPRPCYIFESKRLSRTKYLIDKYCGYNGMERFVDERYAKDYPEVGMLGYVQSDTIDYWEIQLQNFLSTAARLSVQKPLRKITVVPSLTNEWITNHWRISCSPLEVYHIFLDCTSV